MNRTGLRRQPRNAEQVTRDAVIVRRQGLGVGDVARAEGVLRRVVDDNERIAFGIVTVTGVQHRPER